MLNPFNKTWFFFLLPKCPSEANTVQLWRLGRYCLECKFAVAPRVAGRGIANHAQSTNVSDSSKDTAFRHQQSAGHQKRGGNDGGSCISSSNAIALAGIVLYISFHMHKWKKCGSNPQFQLWICCYGAHSCWRVRSVILLYCGLNY